MEVATEVATEATVMEATAATARGPLMPRLTMVAMEVATEATEATAMEATAATARGPLMLTMVVAMEVMVATDMVDMATVTATASKSTKEKSPFNFSPPNLRPDSQSVNTNLKLLYHEL